MKKANAKVTWKAYEELGRVRGASIITAEGFVLADKQNVPPIFRITFEFENGKDITLVVSQKIYDDLKVGDTGVLEYDRKNFERFTIIK